MSYRYAFCFVFMLAHFGCSDGARTLDLPPLDPADVFPGDAVSQSGQTPYEEQIAAFGRYVVTVPRVGGDWQIGQDGEATLIVHRPNEGEPTAWIYAESTSQIVSKLPTAEVARWYATVAPELLGFSGIDGRFANLIPSIQMVQVLKREVPAAAAGFEKLADETPLTLENATSASKFSPMGLVRTLGSGLGVDINLRSFSGWKWLGSLESRLTIRMARMTGESRLGTFSNDPIVRDVVEILARDHSEISDLVDIEASGDGIAYPRRATQFYIGFIAGQPIDHLRSGTSFAIACQSPCAERRELAKMLKSARTPLATDVPLEPFDLSELSYNTGLRIVTSQTFKAMQE
jgi:hypothetical protein